MVLFNHSTRELTAKIVYYGPGLCGKTTNLRLLHEKLDPGTTGRLLSLSTAQDRTIYFDLLPVELGNVKGYTVRFQLCTVPGQVFYNETRKLVLKGVDGIVFVVDSQWSMLSHNLESFQNLRENMKELGQSFEETAVVVQYNKRDLPGVLSVQALQESLGFQEYPYVESVAADAKGVVETFKLVSKLTFVQLLKRLQRSPDGERLGPDWVAPTPPSSQATARIPSVGAELLALASSVGPSPAPPADSPFETTASWPGLAKGEVFGDATIPPFAVEPARAPEDAAAPPDADDTFPEPPAEDRAPAGPEPPTPEATPEPAPEPSEPLPSFAETGREIGTGPGPTGPLPPEAPAAVPDPTAAAAEHPPEAGEAAEPFLAPPEPSPAPPAEAAPPPPPAPEPPVAPPAAAVWAEAFAGLSGRIDELARARAEEAESLASLAREAREAVTGLPGTMREAVSGLAPAAAVEALREALEGHTAEVRPRLLALVEDAARQRDAAFERERAQDDAARDAARRHREEIRGDVERAAAAVRELVEALDGKVDGLRAALEERLGAVERRLEAVEGAAARPEASGKLEEIRLEASETRRLLEAGREDAAAARRADGERLDELRREASEVRRLVEAKLEEAGSQSRRLTGLLRRALEELEPRDGG